MGGLVIRDVYLRPLLPVMTRAQRLAPTAHPYFNEYGIGRRRDKDQWAHLPRSHATNSPGCLQGTHGRHPEPTVQQQKAREPLCGASLVV
jgi:hypothetical protein